MPEYSDSLRRGIEARLAHSWLGVDAARRDIDTLLGEIDRLTEALRKVAEIQTAEVERLRATVDKLQCILRRDVPFTLRAIAGRIHGSPEVSAADLRLTADAIESGQYEKIMAALPTEAQQNQPDARMFCTLCGDLAEFREDEQGWRHAGNSKARGLVVPGEGCDRYGYLIKVRPATPEAGKESNDRRR